MIYKVHPIAKLFHERTGSYRQGLCDAHKLWYSNKFNMQPVQSLVIYFIDFDLQLLEELLKHPWIVPNRDINVYTVKRMLDFDQFRKVKWLLERGFVSIRRVCKAAFLSGSLAMIKHLHNTGVRFTLNMVERCRNSVIIEWIEDNCHYIQRAKIIENSGSDTDSLGEYWVF